MLKPYKELSGPVQRSKTGEPPRQLFFLLHGWGADGGNLLDIALALSHDFPDAEFLMPNAPYPCQNGIGYQWFSLDDADPDKIESGANMALDIVSNYIQQKTKQANLTHENVVLLGFSQGAMLAKHIAIHIPDICSVVAAYSGKLVSVDESSMQNDVPMVLIHGDEDDVIPVEAMIDSYHRLRDLDFTVDAYRMAELGHGINQAGLELGHQFIKQHLGSGE